MKLCYALICVGLLLSGTAYAGTANADDQTKAGVGNAGAIALAKKSPIVQSAYAGHFRLPALRQLENNVDLADLGQTNVLAEYVLHNLSDADFTYSRIPVRRWLL